MPSENPLQLDALKMSPDEDESDKDPAVPAPLEIPIDGVLDLHTFAPSEVKSLVPEYLDECARRGIKQARIIHGKGQGVLRQLVHKLLERHPRVRAYGLADASGGSWGATWVELQPEPDSPTPARPAK